MTEPAETAETPAPTSCAAHVARARALARNGDTSAATEACIAALRSPDVPVPMGIKIEQLLRELGQDGIADQVRAGLLQVADKTLRDHGDNVEALREVAAICLELGLGARAVELGTAALARTPADPDALRFCYMATLRTDAYPPGGFDVEPVLAASSDPVVFLGGIIKMLATFGRHEDALRLVDRARAAVRDDRDRRVLRRIDDALHGRTDPDSQRADAVMLFDGFAETYDQNLAAIQNNGPAMIDRILKEIALPADVRLDVLDAGCGTGLCAPFLRPYAKLLHGNDLSIGMLEKCRAKNSYDLLTRTDLAAAETYPQGTFDLVVCADVLVYIPDLTRTFTNIFDVLNPGGRFVFTVEEKQQGDGYAVTPSGRISHSEPYLREVLQKTGFASVEALLRDALRTEFFKPVAGLAMAARKA
ncbi:class I SAM-dependent DNA methyltransferase [Oceaniglobus roseus]|uniref:class I SAM-dependent DNA methyltransferase n=1 Tax=Oceaniglobus roseus TaxID=1737570 RepID=UPI0012FFE9F1|nr:methyltransferase domain-containing protein [Kandeliimicrobium roseum]